jgi:hypothetical protein
MTVSASVFLTLALFPCALSLLSMHLSISLPLSLFFLLVVSNSHFGSRSHSLAGVLLLIPSQQSASQDVRHSKQSSWSPFSPSISHSHLTLSLSHVSTLLCVSFVAMNRQATWLGLSADTPAVETQFGKCSRPGCENAASAARCPKCHEAELPPTYFCTQV